MWGPIVRIVTLIAGGMALGGVLKEEDKVIIQTTPAPPPVITESSSMPSPMLILAFAVLITAIGYVIWVIRKR